MVALAIVSCVQTDISIDYIAPTYKLESFVGKINDSTGRTTSVQNGNKVQTLWHKDDEVAVTDGHVVGRYTLANGCEGTIEGSFNKADEVGFEADSKLCAVVPYSAFDLYNSSLPGLKPEAGESWNPRTRATKGVLSINIPTEQVYSGVAGANDGDRNIMVATSDDNGATFLFKQVASLARFTVTLNEAQTIYSVKMIAECANLTGRTMLDLDGAAEAPVSVMECSDNTLMLKYAIPVETTVSEGWAIMAPIDWTLVEGRVFYEVSTNEGVYTFCRKPNKAFDAGYVYNFPLAEKSFTKVDSVSELDNGKYTFTKNSVSTALVRATDSTIAIAWTLNPDNTDIGVAYPVSGNNFDDDITKTYKVALYEDALCKSLVVSFDGIAGSTFSATCPPRFVFPDLTPQTTYYAKVWVTTEDAEAESLPLKVATIAPAETDEVVEVDAKEGDLILFENFAKLTYSSDVSARAAGITYKSLSAQTEIHPIKGELTYDASAYILRKGDEEHGLFNNFAKTIDELGLTDWGWIGGKEGADGGSVCLRSGYIKVSASGNRAFVATPTLNAIPDGCSADVKIRFKTAQYGNGNKDENKCVVKAISGTELNDKLMVTYTTEVDSQNFDVVTPEWDTTYKDNTYWTEQEVSLQGVTSDCRILIGGRRSATAANRFQLDDISIRIESLHRPTGRVTYSDGTAAAGVSVSDGFTVVTTNSEGYYYLPQVHEDALYIYYTVPADCEVPINDYGQPAFYTRYEGDDRTYDFTLTKLAGGKEEAFSLFVLADPQCKDDDQCYRFARETMPDVATHAQGKGVPCYGVTLGDVVYSEGDRDSSGYMSDMRDWMAKDYMSMPVFQTFGNHDYTYIFRNSSIKAATSGSNFNIKVQRAFEEVFGPINYSWERGDAHIISMRNMQWVEGDDAAAFDRAFTAEQYAWLQQDLANVPKDKLIIFCVHMPMFNAATIEDDKADLVRNLLKTFNNVRILAGHKHYMRNRVSGVLHEHTVAAVCGSWWHSTINGDGSPNGYAVYDIESSTIKNVYYKGVNEGMNDPNYQIRLYSGDLKAGGKYMSMFDRYFQLQFGSRTILANVFNANNNSTAAAVAWKVEISADGGSTWTDMDYMNGTSYNAAGLGYTDNGYKLGDGVIEIPTDTGQDWWALGYHIGALRLTSAFQYVSCFHMYQHTFETDIDLSKIVVRATDVYGNVYTQDKVISNADSDIYALAKEP